MTIEICKWMNNAASPVIFMIDDFANVWVDVNKNGLVDPGEDWGYAKDGSNSSFRFLNDRILSFFPEVKTTFFTPVAQRAPMIADSPIATIARPINADSAIKAFFQSVDEQPQFEIAYHGTTHGRAGRTKEDFKQEWELFPDLHTAVTTIQEGREIFKDVFGHYPSGGKYCGYVSNDFSDESVNQSGFIWWCRYWNRGILTEPNCPIGGSDRNPLTAFDVKTFGSSNVVDIPSTVNGSLFTGIFQMKDITWKSFIKRVAGKFIYHHRLKQINFLLENRLVISIQEHIAPSRNDGRRQQPNIFDDELSLKLIFEYLRTKNVWYCTGTELAQYVDLRINTKIIHSTGGKFHLVFQNKEYPGNGDALRPQITLKIDPITSQYVICPDGHQALVKNGLVNIPILIGEYRLL